MNDVLRYIPQRPPMVMIEQLIRCEQDEAVSLLKLSESNIFIEEGMLTEAGLIENIAQTAAAMVGYESISKDKPVPLGYIAAVKDLEVKQLPPVLSQIKTTVAVKNQVLNVTILDGRVELDGRVLCSCEMKIVIQG